MILKDRSIPLKILILQAILRRLPLSHSKYQEILDEVGRRLAGYQGEKALDFYFRSLPQNKYMILHDLNLPDGEYNCQIDTLLLTPEFILIVEVKYMVGKLVLDTDNEQFTQISKDKEKAYPYPIAQAERHQKYIMKLLAAHDYPPIPVIYLVVFSNMYCSYSVTGRNSHKVRSQVCKADVMLNRIESIEKKYQNSVLDRKNLRKLSRLLIKMNTPPTSFLLHKYGIQKFELLTGVQCPTCKHLPLIRKRQQWFCPSCESYSKDAHLAALQDYFLLFDSKITNQEFRRFAHLSSIYVSSRLLRSSNLNFSGSTKKRFYSPRGIPR